jgi:Ricin-type beta-trefoil lectin domain
MSAVARGARALPIRPGRCALAAFAAACIALAVPGRAVQAAQLVSSSGSCADIPQNDTNDGTPMILFHCHGTPNENWVLSGGTISGENGVCLDVMGSVPKEGAQIIIVQCNGRPSQKWQVVNGQVIGLGNKCLDLQGGSSGDRTPLVLSTCSATSQSQQWSFQ